MKVFDELNRFSTLQCQEILQTFPQALKNKISKKSGDNSKKLCILEYFHLQKMLGLKNLNPLRLSENGKPYIEGEKFFSISNSENVFCISVSRFQVGVDLQKMIAYDERLAKRICNENEFERLKNSKDKDLELTKLWTKKESLIKCRGETLGQNLKTLLDDTNGFSFRFSKYKDFIICECKKTL